MDQSFKASVFTALLISTTIAPIYSATEPITDTTSKIYLSQGSRKAALIASKIYGCIAIPACLITIVAAASDHLEVSAPAAIVATSFAGLSIWAQLKNYFDYYEIEIPKDIILTINVVNQKEETITTQHESDSDNVSIDSTY